MTEELVTLETAELLKEKGFNERKYLIDVSTLNHCYKYLSVPPQSVAQKWLRETKNIHICVYNCACGYGYEISKVNGTHITSSVYEEPHDDANFKYCFEKYIKDTLPDELSEAVIRLLDLAGLRGISLESASNDINSEYIDDIACMYSQLSFTEAIYSIFIKPIVDYKYLSTIVNEMIFSIFALAKHLDIDLLWHIEQKMRYNELRPMLNGKRY